MNNFNFARNNNGVIRLPPGFRFQPTDEELVFEYLRRKIFSCPLPSSSDIIPEINICKYDPWDLPGAMEQERYFFSNKEAKYRNGSIRVNRKTSSGYWKATGSDKKIVSSTLKNIVGTRKTLVFYRGKGSRTEWFMHEYSLHDMSTQEVSENKLAENWVLCKIFLKEKCTINNNANYNNYYVYNNNSNKDESIEQNWQNFGTNYEPRMFDLRPSSSSSSSSSSPSSVSEVSSSYACHGEKNNGYANF